MSMLGTFTALVAFAAKLPEVDRGSDLLDAAHARIEELESANAELTVDLEAEQLVNEKLRMERDAARARVLEIGEACRHAEARIADLEERLAHYQGRRTLPTCSKSKFQVRGTKASSNRRSLTFYLFRSTISP
jgi:chromosome segregation ATPase